MTDTTLATPKKEPLVRLAKPQMPALALAFLIGPAVWAYALFG